MLTSADAPAGLTDRGLRLWSDSVALKAFTPGERVLLEEACRLSDRLDVLDRLVRGDRSEWLTIEWPFEDQPARLVISSVLTEARQAAAELRQLVKSLNLPAGDAAQGAKRTPSKFDELLAKREAKGA